MTVQGPDRLFFEAKIGSHLSMAVGYACRAGMERELCEAMSGGLEIFGAGMPAPPDLQQLRYDADYWADIATPMEVEAFTAAGLSRIERATFAEKARKRIFMAIWRSFTDKQRGDFIEAMTKGR
jgi:hypothetical protein